MNTFAVLGLFLSAMIPFANADATSNCHYVQPDGKTNATVQGEAVQDIFMDSKSPDCTRTKKGPRRWPSFCGGYISCNGEAPQLMACPTWNDHPNGGCVSADECVKKASLPQPRIQVQVGQNSTDATYDINMVGNPIIVTDSNLGSNQQPVCLIAAHVGDMFFLGTGPAEKDGKSCSTYSMAVDSCINDVRQSNPEGRDLLHPKYTSSTDGGSSSTDESTRSGGAKP